MSVVPNRSVAFFILYLICKMQSHIWLAAHQATCTGYMHMSDG